MSVEKPHILQDGRDMVLSLLALTAIIALSVGMTGLCSFNPGGPEIREAPVRTVDVDTVLSMDARGLPFPVRNPNPELPEDWNPNSVRRTIVGNDQATVAGWVNGTKYLQLTQTNAPMDAVSFGPDQKSRILDGIKDVNGTEWQVYKPVEGGRLMWAADLGQVRVLIDGIGEEPDYRMFAEIVQRLEPLPAEG
ncbi:DUF4245 domain-containing protein [Corynebacterium ulceribovis]|uniref:DUF4245 domain-containing protein n=1 Tax=Corynebacterium ulceribovis TaxID=487732 RepID=UPI00035F0288|nr:DUF4245 domain-containing protein [Corynebacterium ulceribovis]